MKINELTRAIIGAAIEVHRELGPGKPESAYEAALARELALRGLPVQTQKPVPIVYKGLKLDCGYRLDVLVDSTVVIEVKSVELVIPVHRAQVLTYLRVGGWKVALLLNFNVAVLKQGINRLVLGLEEEGSEVELNAAVPVSSIPSITLLPSCAVSCGDVAAEALAREAIAAATEVHQTLGPGLLPSAYEACLCHELHLRNIAFERKRALALSYKGVPLPESDEIELLLDGKVVLSPRAISEIAQVHEAGLLSQLRLGGWQLGLLINFNSINLGDGLHRLVLSRPGR